jgi:16S rRNA (adenine1518-N6/adenine1519-N6)-dimethyltransferase
MSVYPRPPNVRALMRRFELRPNKRLGQNFLIDQASLRRVIAAADVKGTETVLEIGAGLGSLTFYLSRVARKVIAVEYDERLLPALEFVLAPLSNVQIVMGNILDMQISDLIGDRPYCVVANIPYNITSALIRHLLETPHQPSRLLLTLQKEVAERIIAAPGDLSLLALSVQVYGKPTIKGHIPASAFYPQPKVESAMLHMDIHDSPMVPQKHLSTLFRLARVAFNQKRKQLRNSLAAGLGVGRDVVCEWLEAAQINPQSRPQEIDLMTWLRLAQIVDAVGTS